MERSRQQGGGSGVIGSAERARAKGIVARELEDGGGDGDAPPGDYWSSPSSANLRRTPAMSARIVSTWPVTSRAIASAMAPGAWLPSQ